MERPWQLDEEDRHDRAVMIRRRFRERGARPNMFPLEDLFLLIKLFQPDGHTLIPSQQELNELRRIERAFFGE